MKADNKISAATDRRKPLPDECAAPGCSRKPRTRLDNRALCGKHEYRYRKHRSFELPAKADEPWAQCSLAGCERPSRTKRGALCEVHYYRRYRTGTFDDPSYKRRYAVRHGYIRLVGTDCPIAGENGSVMEHRKVLYEAIGPGQHECHWCRKPVRWSKMQRCANNLVVDHLNSVTSDNRRENLVPSCQRCNAARGLFMKWVMSHRDDPFLWQLFHEARLSKEHDWYGRRPNRTRAPHHSDGD